MDGKPDQEPSVYARCIKFLVNEAVRERLPRIHRILSDAYKEILDIEKESEENGNEL
jgi:hypothetical protein